MATKRILVAGGTGGIGVSIRNQIRQLAINEGNSIVSFIILTRSKKNTLPSDSLSFMTWDELNSNGLPDVDSVINLSGSNIMQSKWQKGKPIYTSRIDTTRSLIKAMEKNPPKTFIQASAVGIYPSNTDEIYHEKSILPDYEKMNFPQKLVYDWEQEALTSNTINNLKTTILRIPFVLGPHQNGVKALKLPFNFGIGKIGTGKQAFPWIHEADLAGMIFHASLNPSSTGGIVNAVTNQIITQEQFSTVFNRKMGSLYNIPLPEYLLKFIGEKSVLLLEGPKVITKELPNVIPDFKYYYTTIHEAIENIGH